MECFGLEACLRQAGFRSLDEILNRQPLISYFMIDFSNS